MQKFDIYAWFDEDVVRVYQAFNHQIADEAIRLGKFGTNFSLSKMSWIKPSFLWMAKRSGWGTKYNQERILQIDIYRDAFEGILEKSVLSSYNKPIYKSYKLWSERIKGAEIICQFDPDKDICGQNISRSAIQLGLRGNELRRYVSEYIHRITDITEYLKGQKFNIDLGNEYFLPEEKLFGNYLDYQTLSTHQKDNLDNKSKRKIKGLKKCDLNNNPRTKFKGRKRCLKEKRLFLQNNMDFDFM